MSAVPDSASRGTIVVADDDAPTRMMLAQVLGKAGFTVHACENGQLALEAVRREQPDVVLIDWMMPVMDGCVAVKHLKADAQTRGIPIVMLTTESQIKDRVAALETGVQDILAKPVDTRELLARIDQQIRWRRTLAVDPNVAFAADRLKLYRTWEGGGEPATARQTDSSFFDRIWGAQPKRWSSR